MATEPSGASTMSDLMLRVAEKLGIAEYTTAGLIHVPVDQYNFNLCKRYVNNGIRMFMADSPPKGWRWMRRIMSVTFTTRVTGVADDAGALFLTDLTLADTYDTDDDLNGWYIYITAGTGIGSYAAIDDYTGATGKCDVLDWLDANGDAGGIDPAADSEFAITSTETDNGDTSRYTLSADFGGTIDGKIKYAADSNRGTAIEWCDESTIRARRAVTVNSGTPLLAAIRPYEPTSETLSATRRWEMIVDPMPYAADVVEFPYTLHFDQMQMESGTATAGTGATDLYDSSIDGLYADDYFDEWIIRIIAGTGKGSYAVVNDYVGNPAQFEAYGHDWLSSDGSSGGTHPAADSKYIVEPAANLHPAGHQFDFAIEAACLARTEAESQDEHFDDFWLNFYHKKALPNAHKLDMRSAPRTLGPMLNGPNGPVDCYGRSYGRSFNDVTYD